MLCLNYILFFISLIIVSIDCRERPYRYQFFGSPSTTTTTTTTTTLPTTTVSIPPTTNHNTVRNSSHSLHRINVKYGPYNIYSGLDFILPMLGNTRPTTTTPPSTTPVAMNPIEVLRQRTGNRFCVDKTTCPYCPYEQGGTACCYKRLNRGLNQRGECRCVTRQIDLNKCD